MANVIISEKRDKKQDKFRAKDLPYPYTSSTVPSGDEAATREGVEYAHRDAAVEHAEGDKGGGAGDYAGRSQVLGTRGARLDMLMVGRCFGGRSCGVAVRSKPVGRGSCSAMQWKTCRRAVCVC